MRWTLIVWFAGALFAAVLPAPAQQPETVNVVPRPLRVEMHEGRFTLDEHTKVAFDTKDDQALAAVVSAQFAKPLGAAMDLQSVAGAFDDKHAILLTRAAADASLGAEGYTLEITPDRVTIRATDAPGLFYGFQTLRQLFGPAAESDHKAQLTAPCLLITDKPRFAWRGFMLDVARHFFTKAEVEHVLDLMAYYKLNTFHWHLVDDQGWRIEIKKYPRLTEVGAWRPGIGFKLDPKSTTNYDAQGRYGGFYTQDDIREVIAYAAQRHITIVPEIETPGHSGAALAAYPQFSSTGKDGQVDSTGGIMPHVLNPADEGAFEFVNNVLSEVIDLFPGAYIHCGGDEVPKGPWHENAACQALMKAKGLKTEDELQSYFMKRVEAFVSSKGKHMIGWDEILEGGLAPGAAVMSWRGSEGGIAAAKSGHQVVMSPTTNCYFDYNQSWLPEVHKAIGGYLPLAKVYALDPISGMSPQAAAHVMGVQGNLWTEFVPNIARAEHMAFPRLCALAEAGWTDAPRRDWSDFQRRLPAIIEDLQAMHVNVFVDVTQQRQQVAAWKSRELSPDPKTVDFDITGKLPGPGRTFVLFQYTTGACRLDIKSVELLQDGKPISHDTHDGKTGAADSANIYVVTTDAINPASKYTLRATLRTDGGNDSNGDIYIGSAGNQ